ncbi:NirD/YgiW/YdeI family stress tolerance protein [Reichenbachiella sp.]|uniref:NirD/YgiW/YdeI family stress tolerance protein n=1 Tax=Reichenbachiella sp. TaxID=2184521 RepID=UPI003BAFBDE5
MRKSIAFALFVIAPLVSFAQYTGPNSKKIHYTVEEVKSNGPQYDKEDHLVTLHGYIIEALAERNMYVFRDRTGKIDVKIDVDGLPHTPFDDQDLVVIIGHVKSKKGETKLLVKKTLVLHVDLEELRKQNQQLKMKIDGDKPVKPATPAKPEMAPKPMADEPMEDKNMSEEEEEMDDSEEMEEK